MRIFSGLFSFSSIASEVPTEVNLERFCTVFSKFVDAIKALHSYLPVSNKIDDV